MSLDPPRLVRFVASDFDNADDGYDAGDELELAFDMHTNLGSLDAPGGFRETIDGLFGSRRGWASTTRASGTSASTRRGRAPTG